MVSESGRELPLLTRPEHIVHFFRDVHRTYPITKEALRKRTDDYHRWHKRATGSVRRSAEAVTEGPERSSGPSLLQRPSSAYVGPIVAKGCGR